jgi:hypothetical protein
MRLADSRWSNQNGRLMLLNELTVEQADNFLLRNSLRKIEFVLSQCLHLWQSSRNDTPLKSSLTPSGHFRRYQR